MAGLWRKCRICFRWLRITFRWLRLAVWLIVLAVLACFLWCNFVGLPDFLKTRLVGALREQGVELEFSRMRLSLIHGLVAENVRAGQPGVNEGPSFNARLVQLELDFPALLRRRLALDGIKLRDGNFTLPLSPTNTLALTNLQTDLRFGENDVWSFDQLGADFAGVELGIRGEVAHAREARNWKLFSRGGGGADHGPAAGSLQNFSDVLQQIHFQGRPHLRLTVSGDAREVHSIAIQLEAVGEGVQTPWFSATNFQAAATLTAPADAPTNLPAAAGFWTNLQPFRLDWTARADGVKTEKLDADALACAGVWAAPKLAVTNLSARLGGGSLRAGATLDVPSRRAEFTWDSRFDLHSLGRLFDGQTRTQLAQVSWTQPPELKAELSLRLPPWTNLSASYDPALSLQGEVGFTNTTVRGVKLDHARAHFRYGDLIWEVTDLTVVHGRTELNLSGQESEATKNFRCQIRGGLDAATVRLFVNTNPPFNLMAFHQPGELLLDVTGNWRRLETLSATGRVALADFAIRGVTVDRVAADVVYSNQLAVFLQPRLVRSGGAETFSAGQVELDLAAQKLIITGGKGRVDPMALAAAIGPKTRAAFEPYQFTAIPTVTVNGCIPLKQEHGELVLDEADARFDLVGTAPFRWKRFETPAITGTIHWWKKFIILTNAVTECYGGEARGWGVFDVETPGPGTDFSFSVTGTNVNLHRMGLALWSPTNRLDGLLAGTVNVTRANSDDWRTWNGFGELTLRDGLLWDVPIFAFMSPVMNAVAPGLGNSRATDASAPFIMTNGVIATDSLVIHAQSMQLDYAGTVDLEENVNAKVTAKILRNMPVIGDLISRVLWPVGKIFECRVTGTLGNPVVTPVYIPKILLAPLHPIRSLEELFSPPDTNPPAKAAPEKTSSE
jgi:hypothetical protein